MLDDNGDGRGTEWQDLFDSGEKSSVEAANHSAVPDVSPSARDGEAAMKIIVMSTKAVENSRSPSQ
jgi:hypothetical protein